jgi:hypothetical protein
VEPGLRAGFRDSRAEELLVAILIGVGVLLLILVLIAIDAGQKHGR